MAVDQEVVDKLVADLKESHEKALQLAVKMSERGIDALRIQHEEKVAELEKQNDGLLGAVGRLQGDKAKFEEQVKQLTEEIRKVKLEYEIRIREELAELERRQHEREVELQHEWDNVTQDRERERQKDKSHISDLEKLLKRLQAKKTRK